MPHKVSPPAGNRGASTITGQVVDAGLDSTAYRAEDGYQADAEDRDDARFRAEASARGYKLAAKCLDCGHYVVNETSVRAHRGPVCRKRHAEAVTK